MTKLSSKGFMVYWILAVLTSALFIILGSPIESLSPTPSKMLFLLLFLTFLINCRAQTITLKEAHFRVLSYVFSPLFGTSLINIAHRYVCVS